MKNLSCTAKAKRRRRFSAALAGCLIAALAAFAGVGILRSESLAVPVYTIASPKLNGTVRFALICDLHSCRYGENQRELTDALREAHPDAILLGGDIFDDVLPRAGAEQLIETIAKDYPCYYVTGNHEIWSGGAEKIKDWLREHGVAVLDGAHAVMKTAAGTVNICGMDDPAAFEDQEPAKAIRLQLDSAFAGIDPQNFTLLISHRPELTELFKEYPADLVVSGHTHGGQWRLPGLQGGLIAPNQGLFPAYAGGQYELSSAMTLIISRGLARESTLVPRLFNPPELVIIEATSGQAS